MLANVPARDLLVRKPFQLWSVDRHATVFTAIELMARVRVGAVLVMEKDVLIGIMSERDYARKVILSGRSSLDTRVEEIMSAPVITIDPSTSMQECMELMTRNRIRHLPVLEDSWVLGMISIGDVVREIMIQQSHALDELHRYVTGEPRLGGTTPA
jgi:CBS domain-containing protein